MMNDFLKRIMKVFYGSFINSELELILVPKTNLYFSLNNVKNEIDLKCKIIEWCSRDCYKTAPFHSKEKNEEYNLNVLNNVNRILETSFSFDDIEIVYAKLGNGVNHELTNEFVNSGYDMEILKK